MRLGRRNWRRVRSPADDLELRERHSGEILASHPGLKPVEGKDDQPSAAAIPHHAEGLAGFKSLLRSTGCAPGRTTRSVTQPIARFRITPGLVPCPEIKTPTLQLAMTHSSISGDAPLSNAIPTFNGVICDAIRERLCRMRGPSHP